MSALGQGVRLGSSASCTRSVIFGNSMFVLPRCPLPARPLRSLHLGTKAMGRRGLAELISVGKQRRCVKFHTRHTQKDLTVLIQQLTPKNSYHSGIQAESF